MDLQLTDKLALVTGSSKGIGLAIATQLAEEGARVIINGRSDKSVAKAKEKLLAKVFDAKVELFVGDLASVEGTEKLLKQFPKVDILVNNLGIFEPKPFDETIDDDWTKHFNVNVLSGVRLSRAYLPKMKQQNWGRIVFISSESGIEIPVEMIHYGMTKTAQLAVSRGLAETCKGTAVTVNSVLPGPTASDGVEEFVKQIGGGSLEEAEKEFFTNTRPSSLIQRFATVEEVANLVAYVCSPRSSATNGAALRVDGGCVQSCF